MAQPLAPSPESLLFCRLPTAFCLLSFPSPQPLTFSPLAYSRIGSIGSLQSAGNGLIWSVNLRLEIRSPC